MSVHFDITHTTHYRYHQPVQLGEQRVMFRPRGSHDLRVLATDMKVTPQPVDIRLIQDVYSNSVALVQPQSWSGMLIRIDFIKLPVSRGYCEAALRSRKKFVSSSPHCCASTPPSIRV